MVITQDNANDLLLIGFAVCMVIVFCHALKLYYVNNRASAVNFYANTLTSLGILGTFVGIALGILYFDTQAIDKSLVLMIEGLKTAFLTSIGGLSLSILLKQLTFLKPNKADYALEFDEEPDVIAAITEQTQTLSHSMNDFQKDLAVNIVGELEAVVSQFNDRIAKQFGDNVRHFSNEFKQLNETLSGFSQQVTDFDTHLGKLNNSLTHFEQTHSQSVDGLQQLVDGIHTSHGLLANSADLVSANELNVTQQLKASEHLSSMLVQVQQKLQLFNEQLLSFNEHQWQEQSHISNSFTEKFTRLESQLVDAVNQVKEQAITSNQNLLAQLDSSASIQQNLTSELAESVDLQKQANSQMLEQMNKLAEATESVSEKNSAYIDDVFKRTLDHLESSYEIQKDQLLIQQGDTQSFINDAIGKLNAQHEQLLSNHYQQYQEQLQREMELTLKQLNDVMGFVSGEFARDFQQLITQMNTVKTEFQRQTSESYD